MDGSFEWPDDLPEFVRAGSTVAANILTHGTGALNVDGCRVGFRGDDDERESKDKNRHADFGSGARENRVYGSDERARGENGNYDATGRWPANVVLDPEAGALLDEQAGDRRSAGEYMKGARGGANDFQGAASINIDGVTAAQYADTGGASRFFYCAKASGAERNAGLSGFEAIERVGQSAWAGLCNVCGSRMMLNGKPTCGHDDFEWVTGKPTKNVHPTVKPVDLMRWLVRLVTPPGGLVLDPFAGSGTTGCACAVEGVRFVGIEREAEYAVIAEARIAWWTEHGAAAIDVARRRAEPGDPAALTLFAA